MESRRYQKALENVGSLPLLMTRGLLLWLVVPVGSVVWLLGISWFVGRDIELRRFLGWIDINLIALLQATVFRPFFLSRRTFFHGIADIQRVALFPGLFDVLTNPMPDPKIRANAVRWVSDDQPGWIELSVVDATGRTHQVIDKAAVIAPELTSESTYPTATWIDVEVVEVGPRVVLVQLAHSVETTEGARVLAMAGRDFAGR